MSGCTVSSVCTSSRNRNDEWKRCCADAMGFEWVDCFDEDGGGLKQEDKHCVSNDNEVENEDALQLTNLLHDDHDDFEYDDFFDDRDRRSDRHNHDVWMKNALRIHTDLKRMSQWIQSKKQEYVGLDMKDEEAALIQSTITSFAATTASELETLRNMIQSSSRGEATDINNNLSNHRAGIVQILLTQLQEHVTKPFGILQKQRVRVAVKLWQNPLSCRLYEPLKRRSHEVHSDDNDEDTDPEAHRKEQRFLPMRTYQWSNDSNDVGDFISKYANKRITNIPSKSPSFLHRLMQNKNSLSSSVPSPQQPTLVEEKAFDDVSSPQSFQPRSVGRLAHKSDSMQNNAEFYQQQLEEELRTESAQLTTTLIASNDLDSVQQMETRMVQITALIGQFSNLVQNQQEQILQVNESAKETKDNINKGQENLIDAAERTKQSKHYKAWSILAMAAILLFFQILRN